MEHSKPCKACKRELKKLFELGGETSSIVRQKYKKFLLNFYLPNHAENDRKFKHIIEIKLDINEGSYDRISDLVDMGIISEDCWNILNNSFEIPSDIPVYMNPMIEITERILPGDYAKMCFSFKNNKNILGHLATFDEIVSAHSPAYVDVLSKKAKNNEHLENYMPLSPKIFDFIRYSVGTVIDASQSGEEITIAIPGIGGHHATRKKVWDFVI